MSTDQGRVTERDLTISGDLMFSTVFQDRELCRELIETLLSVSIQSIEAVAPQRKMKVAPSSRAGVVDVLARDSEGRVFDVEMQNVVGKSLPKRVRYYGSLIDVAVFQSGNNFDQLPERIVIFICSDDPFGKGLKRYTCATTCRESGQTVDDGQRSVYVNARGLEGESTPGLDAFLTYVRDGSTMEDDGFVSRVDAAVRATRDDPVWRRDLMLWSLKYQDEFADARREGLAQGLEEGREKGLEEGRAEGREQGREEGREEGRAEGCEEGREQGREEGREQTRSELARLASALAAADRSGELVPALSDQSQLDALLREFGIGQRR